MSKFFACCILIFRLLKSNMQTRDTKILCNLPLKIIVHWVRIWVQLQALPNCVPKCYQKARIQFKSEAWTQISYNECSTKFVFHRILYQAVASGQHKTRWKPVSLFLFSATVTKTSQSIKFPNTKCQANANSHSRLPLVSDEKFLEQWQILGAMTKASKIFKTKFSCY